MYVCLCNGFTDREVRNSAAESDGSVGGVYRALGVRPKCGKCVPTVCEIVRAVAAAGLTQQFAPA